MKREITAAVCCLKTLLIPRARLDPQKIDLFLERFTVALMEKFSGHWFPENPSRGQAYRCIRINEAQWLDPEVLRACQESRIHISQLQLPLNLTLWVDPGEVCCRIGENNPPFSVATFPNSKKGTLNTSSDLGSDGPAGQQALNPEATPWFPTQSVTAVVQNVLHIFHQIGENSPLFPTPRKRP